jgi:glucose/arabinose dehydrogenase
MDRAALTTGRRHDRRKAIAGLVAAIAIAACGTAPTPIPPPSATDVAAAVTSPGPATASASLDIRGGPSPNAGASSVASPPASVAPAAKPTPKATPRPTPKPSPRPTPKPAVKKPITYRAGHLSIGLTAVGGSFSSPILVTNARDGSGRLFVAEQGGRIRIITKSGAKLATPFLDIHSLVSCCGERGLLGLAFHPSYRSNGRFYVDYTDVNGNTVVAEYHRSSTNLASKTARILLRVAQPYPNHNGGMLAFGPDGYLYIALGDGGSAGDPGNRAQNIDSLLGKILRINVNTRTGSLAYGIPSSNPFVGRSGDDRIWSYGLRNPWRFSFDRRTGDLWIGDVGQDRYEEIDRATHASGGGRGVNWGWRVLEGRACYSPSSGCSTSGKRGPIAVYGHSLGCAVIGGYVYRGTAYPAMAGAYLFGDDCSGRIWALTANGASVQTPRLLRDTSLSISSFGEGENGTLYLTDLAGGRVYRISGSLK